MALNVFSSFSRFVGGFFKKNIGEAAAYGIGGALKQPLDPLLQNLTNETWKTYVAAGGSIPLDLEVAASVAAERVQDKDRMADQAAQLGYGPNQFEDAYGEALNAPGLESLYSLWRRGLIDTGAFVHGLDKAKLEDEWKTPLEGLRDVLLSPAELANARQQGYIQQGRQYDEAELQGVTNDRAEIQFEMVGLPPGHAEAQSLFNRGLIDRATFDQMIREGHTKTKYTDVLFESARKLLTATEYVDAHLRGYISEAEMYAGTAMWGLTRADTDVLFKSHGRPITVHQITTGLARGGVYDGPTGAIPAEYLASLQEGSIKPPWYNLAYANRYTIPSYFVLRAMLQDGTLTEAEGADYFKQMGWPPDLADKAAAAYTGGGATKADTHLSKAQTQLWTATHRSYVNDRTDDATATTALTAAGVAPASIPDVLRTWQEERAIVRGGLSPAQIKKAYGAREFDNATAVARLVELGWSVADANTYLGY